MSTAEPAEAREHEPEHRRWLGALLTSGMAVTLTAAMVGLPREHAALPAVARYALEVALPRWGETEPVSEIVNGTRGFDTFGETFRSREPLIVRGLRAAHTGSANDYASYAIAGTLLIIAALRFA